MQTDLPTYYRSTLKEAEFTAARLELATGANYEIVVVGPHRYCIQPGRLLAVLSASHVLEDE